MAYGRNSTVVVAAVTCGAIEWTRHGIPRGISATQVLQKGVAILLRESKSDTVLEFLT